MMKNYMFLPVGFILFAIIVAHFYAPINYNWTENTISELAAQGQENAWIMRVGFIGFGILLTLNALIAWRYENHPFFDNIFIMLYGIAILLSGIFSTAPINSETAYSVNDAKLHSLFATIAGISISIAITLRIFSSHKPAIKFMHLAFLIAITGVSFLFGLAEGNTIFIGQGVVQRILYLTGFTWLIIVGCTGSSSTEKINNV